MKPHSYVYVSGDTSPWLVALAPDEILAMVTDEGASLGSERPEWIALPGVAYLAEYDHDTDVDAYYEVRTDHLRSNQVVGICNVGPQTAAMLKRAQDAA